MEQSAARHGGTRHSAPEGRLSSQLSFFQKISRQQIVTTPYLYVFLVGFDSAVISINTEAL